MTVTGQILGGTADRGLLWININLDFYCRYLLGTQFENISYA